MTALHLIHSQSQLSNPVTIDLIKKAKVVTVGLGVSHQAIKDLNPDCKILISINAHNFYTGGTGNPAWNAWREKVEKHILRDANGEPVRNLDYPDKNYEFRYSAALARDLASASVELLGKYPQADGLYIDDLWFTMPPRYISTYGSYYSPITIDRRWVNYRENLIANLRSLLGVEGLIIANTANGVAKKASGISLEKHVAVETAQTLFAKQGGFWNIDWFREPSIAKEVSNIRILKGILLNN